jgi:hypothetical protein
MPTAFSYHRVFANAHDTNEHVLGVQATAISAGVLGNQ